MKEQIGAVRQALGGHQAHATPPASHSTPAAKSAPAVNSLAASNVDHAKVRALTNEFTRLRKTPDAGASAAFKAKLADLNPAESDMLARGTVGGQAVQGKDHAGRVESVAGSLINRLSPQALEHARKTAGHGSAAAAGSAVADKPVNWPAFGNARKALAEQLKAMRKGKVGASAATNTAASPAAAVDAPASHPEAASIRDKIAREQKTHDLMPEGAAKRMSKGYIEDLKAKLGKVGGVKGESVASPAPTPAVSAPSFQLGSRSGSAARTGSMFGQGKPVEPPQTADAPKPVDLMPGAKPAAARVPAFGINTKPAAAASPFSLSNTAAPAAKPDMFSNTGAGKTPKMFDMKRGDLPGQTSIMDRVPAVDTKTGKTEGETATSKPTAPIPSLSDLILSHEATRDAADHDRSTRESTPSSDTFARPRFGSTPAVRSANEIRHRILPPLAREIGRLSTATAAKPHDAGLRDQLASRLADKHVVSLEGSEPNFWFGRKSKGLIGLENVRPVAHAIHKNEHLKRMGASEAEMKAVPREEGGQQQQQRRRLAAGAKVAPTPSVFGRKPEPTGPVRHNESLTYENPDSKRFGRKTETVKSYLEYRGHKIAKPWEGAHHIIDEHGKHVGSFAGPNGAIEGIDKLIAAKSGHPDPSATVARIQAVRDRLPARP